MGIGGNARGSGGEGEAVLREHGGARQHDGARQRAPADGRGGSGAHGH